jgi:hypothetical protein
MDTETMTVTFEFSPTHDFFDHKTCHRQQVNA